MILLQCFYIIRIYKHFFFFFFLRFLFRYRTRILISWTFFWELTHPNYKTYLYIHTRLYAAALVLFVFIDAAGASHRTGLAGAVVKPVSYLNRKSDKNSQAVASCLSTEYITIHTPHQHNYLWQLC